MTLRRLEALQWYALFAGPVAWAMQHVLLFGIGSAGCATPVASWNVPTTWLQVAVTICFGAAVLAAEAAALVVFRATQQVGDYDPGPWGRLRFFAQAALVGNVLFIVVVVLDGVGGIYHGCGQT